MKQIVTVLLFVFAALLSGFGDEAPTNAPTNKVLHKTKGTRIWISSFAIGNSAVTLTTGQGDWPLANGTNCTPEIPPNVCRQWRTNYGIFRQLFVLAAEKEKLDSASLAKVLSEPDLKSSPEGAILPVEVHSVDVKGELAWLITYRWEYVRTGAPERLQHIMQEAFSQKTLKLVWQAQCD
jgi:hypothetical protein